MADKETGLGFFGRQPVPMFTEGELELVADGSDFVKEGNDNDAPDEYMSEENLELYRHLCRKDD